MHMPCAKSRCNRGVQMLPVKPGCSRLGSRQSRAAARALVMAKRQSDAETKWDKEPDLTGLAERLQAARLKQEHQGAKNVARSPILIPPGKENTVRGRLAARINAARARMACAGEGNSYSEMCDLQALDT